jgi:ATP-binding cassette subfamily B (MDR/TAP) protein 6
MWAHQITAAGGLPVDGGLREPVSGYQIDEAIPLSDKPVTADIDTAPTQDTAEPQTEAPEAPMEDTAPAQDTVLERTKPQDLLSPDGSAAAAVAGTQVDDVATTNRSSDLGGGPVSDAAPPKANPVAFPTSDSAPIAFPTSTSDETASQKAPSTTQTPGITFAQGVSTPERTGTPDPESETKRKRISSQNFQRLARRISVTTKRAGSVSGIPILGNFRRDATSGSGSTPAQESTDGDGGPKVSSESPAPSISDSDKDKTKKEKEKKKRRFI